MSMQVNEFRHIPGKNDAEYIKLLKEALERQKQITGKAIAKIKELSNSLESPNGWIPCTKEYPKPWELVWTTDKHGNVGVCQLSHKDSDWYDANEKWFYNHDSIIAWMPYEVPNPYQPKENDHE